MTRAHERRHHNLESVEYGPNLKLLANLIAERSLKPVIACEKPNLDVDALKLREVFSNKDQDLEKVKLVSICWYKQRAQR